jgi:hypothetical protein
VTRRSSCVRGDHTRAHVRPRRRADHRPARRARGAGLGCGCGHDRLAHSTAPSADRLAGNGVSQSASCRLDLGRAEESSEVVLHPFPGRPAE